MSPNDALTLKDLVTVRDWVAIALLFAVPCLSAVAGAFIGAYFGKRGETAAIQKDLDMLVANTETLTKATKEVHSRIEQRDWLLREWKTLHIQKLQELLSAASQYQVWVEQEIDNADFTSYRLKPPPTYELLNTCDLYFPSLAMKVNAFFAAGAEVQKITERVFTALKDAPKSFDDVPKDKLDPQRVCNALKEGLENEDK